MEAAKADAAEKMPVIAQLARELGCAIVVGFAEVSRLLLPAMPDGNPAMPKRQLSETQGLPDKA